VSVEFICIRALLTLGIGVLVYRIKISSLLYVLWRVCMCYCWYCDVGLATVKDEIVKSATVCYVGCWYCAVGFTTLKNRSETVRKLLVKSVLAR
jgi:hypothetical protein